MVGALSKTKYLPPTTGVVVKAIFKATSLRLKNQPFIDEPSFNPAKGF